MYLAAVNISFPSVKLTVMTTIQGGRLVNWTLYGKWEETNLV